MASSDDRARFEARYEQDHPEWMGGEASNLEFRISCVELEGGDVLDLVPEGITAVVGANNVGKSTLLREINACLQRDPHQSDDVSRRLIVMRLDLAISGDPSDLFAWLGSQGPLVQINESDLGFARVGGGALHPNTAAAYWQIGESGAVGGLAPFFVSYGLALNRLGLVSGVEMRADAASAPEHPLHRLEDSHALLEELNGIVQEVFGEHLELDRLGRTVTLRVGVVTEPVPPVNAVTLEYRTAMANLPQLQDQGDGMRSMLGLVLPLLASEVKVVIIDEPEAFLHPPQAQSLGRVLGRLAKERGIQVVLSTHDRSLLAGILASDADLSVVRLERKGSQPKASQLKTEDLKSLWRDPVLKHTSVLEGLFHRVVVLCEAEGDCHYFASALDVTEPPGAIPRSEILFAPTNGKAAMAKVARMLRAVQVPVVISADLDLLDDPVSVRRCVEAMGGVWSDFEHLHAQVVSGVTGLGTGVNCGQALDSLEGLLNHRRTQAFDAEIRDEVRRKLGKMVNPWEILKTSGIRALKGDAYSAASKLLTELDRLGIVLVEEGTLERLAPEVTVRKGPEWVAAAIEQGAPANIETQKHLGRLLSTGPVQSVAE